VPCNTKKYPKSQNKIEGEEAYKSKDGATKYKQEENVGLQQDNRILLHENLSKVKLY